MIPLIVMVVAWGIFRALGAAGKMPSAATAPGALRYALAVMFMFTALSHFMPATRADFIRMVPPQLPAPALLVTLTGVLELAGAVGLLLPGTARLAAWCLLALLVAMFPANIYADAAGLEVAGQRATPLVWRLPLQLLWIAALAWVARSTGRPRSVHAA